MIMAISVFHFLVSQYVLNVSLISLGYPIGGAIGQLISPLVGDSRRSVSSFFTLIIQCRPERTQILVLGIISTAVVPAVFLIGAAPPSPPSQLCILPHALFSQLFTPLPTAYAGSQKSPSLMSLIRAMFGKETSPGAQMTPRERVDFSIIILIFAALVAA